jgi:hypothetical protein
VAQHSASMGSIILATAAQKYDATLARVDAVMVRGRIEHTDLAGSSVTTAAKPGAKSGR